MIGAIDGALTGQIAGGQIGGRSIAFWQSGCICPLTHWQMQDAVAPWLPAAHKPSFVYRQRFRRLPLLSSFSRAQSDAAFAATSACHSFLLHPQFKRANRLGDIMRTIGTVVLGVALAAFSLAVLPTPGHAYTPEEQAACQPDAFRLCGSEIPNIDRVKACMVARRAELSPECKRFFRADPEPVAVTAPSAARPVNIRPKAPKSAKPAKPAKPGAARSTKKPVKPVSTKPSSTKKPAAPKAKKPVKPAAT